MNSEPVTVDSSGSNGNVTPSQTIEGSNTALNGPAGLVVDAKENIYVPNFGNNTVTVYAKGATGNVASIRTISGANTGLNQVIQLELDATKKLYAVNYGNASVTVYASGVKGQRQAQADDRRKPHANELVRRHRLGW